ncbi:hypothetical protein EDB80DRAFT_711606 [Ilyonectria destructans]|nr:hypothetical protein EDB80DRAFT_711606 [Ilyonectria destructans]
MVDLDPTLAFYYASLVFLSAFVTVPFRDGEFIFSNVIWLFLAFLDGAILWSWGDREPRDSPMKSQLLMLGLVVLFFWLIFSLIVAINGSGQVALDEPKKEEQKKKEVSEAEKRSGAKVASD